MRIYWLNNGLQITGTEYELKVLDGIYQHLLALDSIEFGREPGPDDMGDEKRRKQSRARFTNRFTRS